jgi:hypothetical protein
MTNHRLKTFLKGYMDYFA